MMMNVPIKLTPEMWQVATRWPLTPAQFERLWAELLAAALLSKAHVSNCKFPAEPCTCFGVNEIGPFNHDNIEEFKRAHAEAIHPLHVPRERLGSDTVCSCPVCRRKV